MAFSRFTFSPVFPLRTASASLVQSTFNLMSILLPDSLITVPHLSHTNFSLFQGP